MTYDDFMKILDDTQSMIISKDLFRTLLDSPNRITAVEKKKIYDDAYDLGYSTGKAERRELGNWIKHKYNGIEYVECSSCSVWFLRMHLLHNSYCPNCGSHNIWKEQRGSMTREE